MQEEHAMSTRQIKDELSEPHKQIESKNNCEQREQIESKNNDRLMYRQQTTTIYRRLDDDERGCKSLSVRRARP